MTGSSSLFSSVIEDHLALKRQNSHLDDDMPIDEFAVHDPFQNHPLFKTEAEARAEEEETGEHPAVSLEMPADTLTMPVMEEPEEGAHRLDRNYHGPRLPLGVADGCKPSSHGVASVGPCQALCLPCSLRDSVFARHLTAANRRLAASR